MVEKAHPRPPVRPGIRLRLRAVAATATLLAFGTIHLAATDAADTTEPVNFQRDVAPILAANCLRCHGSDSSEGDLSLSNANGMREAGIVVPGKPDESRLLIVVQADGDQPPVMPKEGTPLTAAEIDVLRRWIEAGADWPEEVTLKPRTKADSTWWSLQPTPNPTPPRTDSSSRNAIDHFVRAKLDEKSLHSSPTADRRTLIRRLYFDLVGLPPSPEAVAEFVANPNPKAYE